MSHGDVRPGHNLATASDSNAATVGLTIGGSVRSSWGPELHYGNSSASAAQPSRSQMRTITCARSRDATGDEVSEQVLMRHLPLNTLVSQDLHPAGVAGVLRKLTIFDLPGDSDIPAKKISKSRGLRATGLQRIQ